MGVVRLQWIVGSEKIEKERIQCLPGEEREQHGRMGGGGGAARSQEVRSRETFLLLFEEQRLRHNPRLRGERGEENSQKEEKLINGEKLWRQRG